MQYALFSSCVFAEDDNHERVYKFLEGFGDTGEECDTQVVIWPACMMSLRIFVNLVGSVCPELQVSREISQIVKSGVPPPALLSTTGNDNTCTDSNQCEFACIAEGFDISRNHNRLSLEFSKTYFGDCPCPNMTGIVIYNTTSTTSFSASVSNIARDCRQSVTGDSTQGTRVCDN